MKVQCTRCRNKHDESEQVEVQPIYDRYGRMKYHPEFHPNHKKPWTTYEERYLIEYYEQIGPDQLSAELGRTILTVMQRATELRKSGRLRDKRRHHHRMRP